MFVNTCFFLNCVLYLQANCNFFWCVTEHVCKYRGFFCCCCFYAVSQTPDLNKTKPAVSVGAKEIHDQLMWRKENILIKKEQTADVEILSQTKCLYFICDVQTISNYLISIPPPTKKNNKKTKQKATKKQKKTKQNKKKKKIEIKINFKMSSQLGLPNTPTASLLKGKTPPTSVLDMTLNNLMVRFQ